MSRCLASEVEFRNHCCPIHAGGSAFSEFSECGGRVRSPLTHQLCRRHGDRSRTVSAHMTRARSSVTSATSDDRRAMARSADERARSAIAGALARLAQAELRALVVAANALRLYAADLLSWRPRLADREHSRRTGLHLPAQPPEAAMPPAGHVAGAVAVTALRDGYADSGGGHCARAVALMGANARTLTAGARLQQCGLPRLSAA
jgi:hypothetical protein